MLGSCHTIQSSPTEDLRQGDAAAPVVGFVHLVIMSPAGSSRRTALRNSLMSLAANVAGVHCVPVKLQFVPEIAMDVNDHAVLLFKAAA